MNVNIESSEAIVKLVNKILFQIVRNNEGLTTEEKNGLEKFRLDMIKPLVLNSPHTLSEAFLQYYASTPVDKKRKKT